MAHHKYGNKVQYSVMGLCSKQAFLKNKARLYFIIVVISLLLLLLFLFAFPIWSNIKYLQAQENFEYN